MVRDQGLFGALLLAAWLGGPAQAREEAHPFAASIAGAIESCVDRSAIRFGANDRRAVLDAADAKAVSAALVRRYPMIENDGLAPQAIVLWRKPDMGWVFVALLINPAKPGEHCFTATFSASRFEITGVLLDKYFGIGPPRAES